MKKLVFWALSPVWMPLSIIASVVAISSTLLLDQLDLFYDWAHQPTPHGAINGKRPPVPFVQCSALRSTSDAGIPPRGAGSSLSLDC